MTHACISTLDTDGCKRPLSRTFAPDVFLFLLFASFSLVNYVYEPQRLDKATPKQSSYYPSSLKVLPAMHPDLHLCRPSIHRGNHFVDMGAR